jgi:MIP family channel proteins
MSMQTWRPYVAEFIATFALIFVGAGSILADQFSGGNIGVTGIALAHGLILVTMIYATAHLSGAHINPAVTVAMWVTKRIATLQAVWYIAAQLAGAIAGGFALKAIYAESLGTLATGANPLRDLYLGTPALAGDIPVLTGILIEAILTFFLVFVIFGVAVDKRAPSGLFGLAIGLIVTADILIGGPLTGAAMNPARALGPALASGFFDNHLVYWIGPLLGAILAGTLYEYLFLGDGKATDRKS